MTKRNRRNANTRTEVLGAVYQLSEVHGSRVTAVAVARRLGIDETAAKRALATLAALGKLEALHWAGYQSIYRRAA